jgi:hypothetical protein
MSFHVLAISEKQVALYAGDEQSIQKVKVPDLPANLVESLNYSGADRGSQVHSAMRDVAGKQAAVFHGQGGQADTKKVDQMAYCAEVDKAVTAWLGDSTRPLLLAGVEQLATVYRKKNSYTHLLDKTLTGNHDHKSNHQLHEGAWKIVQPLLKSEGAKVANLYAERLGTKKVSDDPCQVVADACQGRVGWLLYDPKAQLLGQCVSAGAEVHITGQSHDDDLVDLAAIKTLQHGGEIYAMTEQDVPTNSPLAAIFRY